MHTLEKKNKMFVRPKILVLLATYNGAEWIAQQLDSILNQDDVDVDIIVGDDLSTDATRGIINSHYAGKKVRLIEWYDPSGSAGANFRRLYVHANVSDYSFVALADQDDVWDSRKLISAVSCLDRACADGYSGAVQAFWDDGRRKVLRQNSKTRSADFLFEGAGQGCSFVVRSEFFLMVQNFCRKHADMVETLHYHDWLIYLLSRAWSRKWYFDETPLMHYRQHSGNEIGSRGGILALKKRIVLIKSGWFGKQVKAATGLYRLAGGVNQSALQIGSLFEGEVLLGDRLRLSCLIMRHGRRRLGDRLVLSLFAVVGWI